MSLAIEPDVLTAKRALEALRNGVPNGDAVRALGCGQPNVIEPVEARLDQLARADADELPVIPGALVRGDFGSGKSHLLKYLEQAGLDRGFVCSTIVISKETPLYDPVKVVNAALREAKVPGRRGSAIAELAQTVDYRSAPATGLVRWAARAPGLIGATVHLHEHSKDQDLLQKVVDFWSGDKLGVAEVRAGLRQVGAQGAYDVKAIKHAELAGLRLELGIRLARANGFKGWLLMVDEVELVGRYSLRQRGRSYGELARWLGVAGTNPVAGLLAVATITDDYSLVVLDKRNDRVLVGERLRARGHDADLQQAARAEAGIRLIEREAMELEAPSVSMLQATSERLRSVYATAYNWSPPPTSDLAGAQTRKMRSYIRRWINDWDLRSLYPGVEVHLEEEEVHISYEEDASLEEQIDEP